MQHSIWYFAGVLIGLAGYLLAFACVLAVPYLMFLFCRMCWRRFMAPNRIYEELRLARLDRESAGGAPQPTRRQKGWIYPDGR